MAGQMQSVNESSHAELSQNASAPDPTPVFKTPTGLGAEPLNIVALGASYAGLAVTHHFLDDSINHLRTTSAMPTYRLIIINPSTHMYWNVAAPCAVVSPNLLQDGRLFIPIEQALHRHRAHNPTFIQGEATALDTSARTITIHVIGATARKRASVVNKRKSVVLPESSAGQEDKIQTITYHALIIAVGSSAHSDMLSLHGPHLAALGALNAFHSHLDLTNTHTIVVAGGGCSGVEIAGQLAISQRQPMRRIVLICGGEGCLPAARNMKMSTKAERKLERLGVEIMHNVRVVAAREDSSPPGQTCVQLSNGSSIFADLFIPCTGVEPNTTFLPTRMKNKDGYIDTDASLRVGEAAAGPRVYAIGDCASYSRNCLQDVYDAVPVLVKNLLNDLLAHEYQLTSRDHLNHDHAGTLQDAVYVQQEKQSMLVPIGRYGG
jgi:NADH dehydrogenase FAD-containing subunit